MWNSISTLCTKQKNQKFQKDMNWNMMWNKSIVCNLGIQFMDWCKQQDLKEMYRMIKYVLDTSTKGLKRKLQNTETDWT